MLHIDIPEKTRSFSLRETFFDLPDLIQIQQKSYDEFLQKNVKPAERKPQGLQGLFEDIFPVENIDGSMRLNFFGYKIEDPVYCLKEAVKRDLTYALPVRVKFSLEVCLEGREKPEIREEAIYLFDLPMMTSTGTFVINGVERVVVNQLHRSPGVNFEEDEKKGVSNLGKTLYMGRIIPYRGSWIEFEYNNQNELFVRINRKRKIPATVILRAMGWEKDEDILRLFYKTKMIDIKGKKSDQLIGKIIVTPPEAVKTKEAEDEFMGRPNQLINKAILYKWKKHGARKVELADLNHWQTGKTINDQTIHLTLNRDNVSCRMDAIYEIFKILRSQQHITAEAAEEYFDTLFFKGTRKYDLTKVGRYKINKKLKAVYEESNLPITELNKRNLVPSDIICTMKYLIKLNNGTGGEIDDIDHLGSRRVRTVGEQLENQLRRGVSHLARLVKSKMNLLSREDVTPSTLINPVPISAAISKFFGTGELSQFMAQTNPLAELTHKRRTSALGPGGLNRKRAGFEVRDVHHTHYGRICPIETPEGANIGLRTSLSMYASINKYGLIETPYRKVVNGKITDKIEYLTADVEDEHIIAPANAEIGNTGNLPGGLIIARQRGTFPQVKKEGIDYMDISARQMVGAAAGLIPFLEHDDANRALMGSNMQRQALPLMITEPPIVATGMEGTVARNTGALVMAERSGEVIYADGSQIIVCHKTDKNIISPEDISIYELKKYIRSNQDTNYNQTPLVKKGDKVKKGSVLADGPATARGQLALGRNLLAAFMSWEGYNFEDAILISERLVKDDVFTSIHIREEEVEARDLKMGSEEITRDIPNVSQQKLGNLDDNGVIRVGAYVRPKDVLVGKVTPKGRTKYTPEVRLLRTIFGKKAEETKDSSLRVPPGVEGKVIRVEIFKRKGSLTKKRRQKAINEIDEKYGTQIEELRKEKNSRNRKMAQLVKNKELSKEEYEESKQRNNALTQALLMKLEDNKRIEIYCVDKDDELPVMVSKKVKVYIACHRKISVGDKIAGRHGNKGVISRILPEEDMPYTEDGTPIDIILNPLGVPSRMNVGQILEAHIGWAAKEENIQVITPVFDGATEDDIKEMLKKNNLPATGQTRLYDGRTGDVLGNDITIGYMYVLKLEHMAEDKVHARSTGPYSLITRQPLGGKAMFGGQRFGEMEVWAMEGYGASYILQELLTYKSDDVKARTAVHEAIIKGDEIPGTGIPESFKVLVKELQGLGLKVLLENRKKNE